MTKEQAFEFLRQHQPMPEDNDLTEKLLTDFREIHHYFVQHPDPECIPLFLNSFSDSMGFGAFQLCGDIFQQYDISLVTSHLVDALRSNHKGVRWWAAHWAMELESEELIEPLAELLASNVDEDAHYFALSTLEFIWRNTGNEKAIAILEQRREVETDPERIELIDEALKARDEELRKN